MFKSPLLKKRNSPQPLRFLTFITVHLLHYSTSIRLVITVPSALIISTTYNPFEVLGITTFRLPSPS